MSGVITAVAIGAVATQVYSARKAEKAQEKALQQQEQAQAQVQKNAKDQQLKSQREINKVNQRQPDLQGILSDASAPFASGAAGTLLTGPAGIDPNALTLGRKTLLGG